jgi:hypothetical protein
MNPILASRKSHRNGLGVEISKRDDGTGSYFSIDFNPFLPGDDARTRLGRASVVTLRSGDIQKAEEQADNLVRDRTAHLCSDGCSKWNRVADSR